MLKLQSKNIQNICLNKTFKQIFKEDIKLKIISRKKYHRKTLFKTSELEN